MKKIKIAIVGFGNLGRGVLRAIGKNSDMELVEIITRHRERVKKEVENIPLFAVDQFEQLADVAILCGGSKEDLFGITTNRTYGDKNKKIENGRVMGQGPYFAQFFNTVDSFDTHSRIFDYYQYMGKFAKLNRHTAIVSAGWDPGTFSLERVLAGTFLPDATHYTFWGPGVSQGHSDAVRQIKGVKDARQYTLPIEKAIERVRAGENPQLKTKEKHKRLVYVVVKEGSDKKRIAKEIKEMSNYFTDYITIVIFISEEDMRMNHSTFPHAGFVFASRKAEHKALIEYRCEWGSNPDATGGILVACARACFRLNREKKFGAFTMLDIPPAYYTTHTRKELLTAYM